MLWLPLEKLFIAERAKCILRHVRAVRHDHVGEALGQVIFHSLQKRHKRNIGEEHLIGGMVDDIDELFGR